MERSLDHNANTNKNYFGVKNYRSLTREQPSATKTNEFIKVQDGP